MFQGLTEVRARLEKAEDLLGKHGTRIEQLERAPNTLQSITTELRLREEKRNNLIIKGLPEAWGMHPNDKKGQTWQISKRSSRP